MVMNLNNKNEILKRANFLLRDGIKKTFDYIKSRGVRPFDYNINIEINNELTPSTWKNKEI